MDDALLGLQSEVDSVLLGVHAFAVLAGSGLSSTRGGPGPIPWHPGSQTWQFLVRTLADKIHQEWTEGFTAHADQHIGAGHQVLDTVNLAPLNRVQLPNVKLHHIGRFFQERPQTPGHPPAQHHAPPHRGLCVFHQQEAPLSVRRVSRWSGRARVGSVGSPAVVGPCSGVFGSNIHVYRLSLATVGAEVAAAVLQLLYVADGVGPARGGHRAHTEW